uniref:Helicase n=1 Tax=Globodera pallida TaxID=36090 RepID=A0A183BZJ0_GLOPA
MNVHAIKMPKKLTMLGGNIFAKTEYQWLNAVHSKSGESKCQNASVNGCGGFGNNCYYCDICKSLRSIDEKPDKSNLPPDIAKQFKGMNCPDKTGIYSFRKEFCFNDWSILDANRDCRLDFLESISPSAESDQIGDVQSAMAALQQGTLVAKVRLAYNATPEIEAKRAQKEAQIERTEGDDFANFTQWAIEQRKGNWHKSEYLPWLLYENEIACIRLTFDICQQQPWRKWDGVDGRYTCT